MPGITRRYFLRKKEKKRFLQKLSRTLEIDPKRLFGSKPQIEVIETSRKRIFVINGLPVLVGSKNTFFPTLLFKESFPLLKKIVVDMGAVPRICNGADVMAPGIVEINGDFEKNSLVVVLDERNRRPIAVVRSLFDSGSATALKKGKVFENLHYVGDEVWNVIKELAGNEKAKT